MQKQTKNMILKNIVIQQHHHLKHAILTIQDGIITDLVTEPYDHTKANESTFFVTPGFVNAHLHPNQLLDRGILDDLAINELLSTMHIDFNKTYQMRYDQALFVLMDAILSGSTSIYAVASNPKPVVDALKFYGLRSAVSCFFNDRWDGHGNQPKQVSFDQIAQKFHEFHKTKDENVDIHIGTASIQTASNDLLKLFDKLATQYNTKVNLHISEGIESVQSCVASRKTSPVRLLDELGVLNSNWNLIHATSIDEEEVKLIAKNNANVILCPVSNAKTGVGVAPIKSFLEHNVNLGLGTDACSNNNTNNILNEAYTAQLIFNATNKNATCITYKDLAKWTSINGSKILGHSDTGEIAIGKRADLLLWSLSNTAFTPLGYENYLSALFYNAPDLKPHTVLLGGVKAVENYDFLLVNPQELSQKISGYVTTAMQNTKTPISKQA